MIIQHIYISPQHNFYGHHGQPPGSSPSQSVAEVECVAGAGIRGDRFFNYKEDYKGQVTFFAIETYEMLCQQLHVSDKDPSVFRRNIITRGTDLRQLIGQEFEVQGIRFLGTQESSPCYWMDEAFAPGAEAAMKGLGGLRAKVLTSGNLRISSPT